MLCAAVLVGTPASVSVPPASAQTSNRTIEVAAPSGGGGLTLSGVFCTSSGNCVAAGSYVDSSGNVQAAVATEANGTWQAQKIVAPSGIGPDPGAALYSVSCSSEGNCVAVGEYQPQINVSELPMEATETNGTWGQAAGVALPAEAKGPGNAAVLDGVSCTSAGSCTAVGDYVNVNTMPADEGWRRRGRLARELPHRPTPRTLRTSGTT